MPVSVFEYSDHKPFLQAHVERLKHARPGWSLGAWAKQLQLRSTSSLTKILNGQRVPNSETTEKFIQNLKLQTSEAAHFRDLIEIGRLKKKPALKAMVLEKLGKPTKKPTLNLTEEEYSLVSKWYVYALMEMARMPLFRDNPHWLANRFRNEVPQEEIEKSLAVLTRLGILKKQKGKYIPQIVNVESTTDIASRTLRKHHEETLQQTISALELPVDKREITNTTFVMPESDLACAKQTVRDFKNKFVSRYDTEKGDTVYRIQVQIVPVTKPLKGLETP